MRGFPRVVLFLVCAATLTATAAFAGETIRYKFTPGQKLDYKMVQETEQVASLPGQTITTIINQDTNMQWLIEEVNEDGTAIIKQSIDGMRLAMKGPIGSFSYDSNSDEEVSGPVASMIKPILDSLKGAQFTVTMSSRGEIENIEVPDGVIQAMKKVPNAQMMGEMFSKEGFQKMMSTGSLTFPEGELTVGDEWSASFEMKNPALGGKQAIVTKYRYAGQETVEGSSYDKFDVSIMLDFGEGNVAGGKLKITEQESTGTILFDRSAGRMKSAEINMNMDMEVSPVSATPSRRN